MLLGIRCFNQHRAECGCCFAHRRHAIYSCTCCLFVLLQSFYFTHKKNQILASDPEKRSFVAASLRWKEDKKAALNPVQSSSSGILTCSLNPRGTRALTGWSAAAPVDCPPKTLQLETGQMAIKWLHGYSPLQVCLYLYAQSNVLYMIRSLRFYKHWKRTEMQRKKNMNFSVHTYRCK